MESPETLAAVAHAMRAGGVTAFPTDTVYGLGTAAFHREGIARIFALKGREAEKALPVLLADATDLSRVVASVSSQALGVIAWFWPGPLTLVLPRRPDLPAEIAPGRATIGVRVPDHAQLRSLIRLVGLPLASSSANHSGSPPALNAQTALGYFTTGLSAVLDGGAVSGGVPSTVLNLTDPDRPTVLREGAVSRWALEDVLGQWVY
ncbi:MAG TPA: L-threonylcarbamoyladenylate synthase [Chloroflexota bacterium]|nr:L-threonylcarbamoyladenylate synthase [Chloroflexota bacterium]